MSVGRNAKQAIVFLKSFYRDVQSLMVACEQQLGEHGWKPPASSQISELSNSLRKPNRWVLDSVFRSYMQADGSREALVILVLLNMRQFDDAQVLVVRGHFDKPVKHRRIWHRWTNATRMIEFLVTEPGTTEIPKDAYQDGALPDASRVNGFLVPLDKLTDEEALRSLVIEPLLKLP